MKLYLAPLQGMTSHYYRTVFSELFGGIDRYFTPFITTTEPNKFSLSLLKDIIPENNQNMSQVVPQLLGNNGADFKFYASKITELGYKEINWNIGCPYPMVTKKKKGSGLLMDPELIHSFLDTVCHQIHYDLSIKMRLGYNDLDEGIEIIKLLNQYPIKEVTIHARFGFQKYQGNVHIDDFKTLLALSNHPVVYNGDIFNVDDFHSINTQLDTINTFMIGRGALRNPFLPSMIKGTFIDNIEKTIKIKQFHDLIYAYNKAILSGNRHLLDRMKEFWVYLAPIVDSSGKFLKKIRKAKTADHYNVIVNQLFFSTDSFEGFE